MWYFFKYQCSVYAFLISNGTALISIVPRLKVFQHILQVASKSLLVTAYHSWYFSSWSRTFTYATVYFYSVVLLLSLNKRSEYFFHHWATLHRKLVAYLIPRMCLFSHVYDFTGQLKLLKAFAESLCETDNVARRPKIVELLNLKVAWPE